MIESASTPPRKQHVRPLLLILLASLIAVGPLFVRGPSCGHDVDFHLLSWIEAAHDWHHLLLEPQWLATANYGAGEPRFVFYPPVSWVLGAALGGAASLLAGENHGWMLALVLLTWLSIFIAGSGVYFLAAAVTSRKPALIAACLFTANPYLLFVAYERTAYGELLATGIIALLLLQTIQQEVPIVTTALTIAALWLTNAPAAVMGCYTLAFVTVIRLMLDQKWLNFLRAGIACALGIALAGFYLVPAAWEQHWIQISRAVGPGMRIEDSFLFEHTGEAFHDQVLHTSSLLAVIIISIGFVAASAAWLQRNDFQKLIVPASLLSLILVLQFPWSRLVWHALPQLAFLQFPWRWLLVASIAAAWLLALALETLQAYRVQVAVALLVVLASTWLCTRTFYQPCDDEDAVSAQLIDFHSGAGVEGTDEYTADHADNSEIQQHLPRVRLLVNPDDDLPPVNTGDNPEWTSKGGSTGNVTVKDWQPETKSVVVETKKPAYAVVTLMEYPAWTVAVNGQPVIHLPHRDDGLIVVPLQPGRSVITARWRTTPDVWLGRALSAVALVIVALLRGFTRRLQADEP